jgi:hypothetical protein
VLDWRDLDDQVGWRVLTTRRLLADLVGGEAGKNMIRPFVHFTETGRGRLYTV